MIRRLAAVVACLTITAAAGASPVRAGTFAVHACHSDGVNHSWQAFHSNGYTAAYTECPGGVYANGHLNEGMVARNTGGGGSAPIASHAEVFFTAPPGARVVGLSGQVMLQRTGSWQAGIHDDTANRWVWCGDKCLSSFDQWVGFNLGGLSSGRVSAFVICAYSGGCDRDSRHAYTAIKDVSVIVADDIAPGVSIAGGSLVARGWRRGVQDVLVDASDGAGVRETAVAVDGGRARGRTRLRLHMGVPCPNGRDSLLVDTRALRTAPLADSHGD